MHKINIILLFLVFLISGCASEEPDMGSSDESPVSEYIFLDFNRWIYAEMNHNYLWREDMPDSLDCNYDLFPKDFFQSLLSPKDRFSYFTSNPYYKKTKSLQNPGFAFQEYRDKKGNAALQVLYVTSNNALRAGLKRGDFVRLLSNNSLRVDLKRIILDKGIFYDNNEVLEYSISDVLDKQNTVLLDTIYKLSERKVGYLCYLEFNKIEDLRKPFQKFKDSSINELIVDLRYNPGGYVNTCKYLCNCIVPKEAYGAVFQENSYNDILSQYYFTTTGNERTFYYFDYPTSEGQISLGMPVYELDLDRVIILTSKHTASASEAAIVCLQPYMEVITIGEQTLGKGVGSKTLLNYDYEYAIQPIIMRYYNVHNETTPDNGLIPNFFIEGGFNTQKIEIGDIEEPLLKAALEYFRNSSINGELTDQTRSEDSSIEPFGDPSFVIEHINKQNYEY